MLLQPIYLIIFDRSVTAGVILGAADFVGQALERSQNESDEEQGVDFARVARFAFFGFILQVSE